MRTFKGKIATSKTGSDCEFEFQVNDDATDTEIEQEAQEAAFDCIKWSFEEIAPSD